MLAIPLSAVPAQVVSVLLENQLATITLRPPSTGLFINLESGGQEIIGLVIRENGNRIVPDT